MGTPLTSMMIQPVALAPWGWRAARAAAGSLNEIRHELLGDDGTASAALRLERFRWRTVATAVALTVAAYLLVGEISGVNVLGTLGQANPGWLAVAALASAVTYLGAAIGIAAFVPQRLSIWRGFFVLTAIGIPAHQAIPAVLLFRMATFWLPIPFGWLSYVVLQRRGAL